MQHIKFILGLSTTLLFTSISYANNNFGLLGADMSQSVDAYAPKVFIDEQQPQIVKPAIKPTTSAQQSAKIFQSIQPPKQTIKTIKPIQKLQQHHKPIAVYTAQSLHPKYSFKVANGNLLDNLTAMANKFKLHLIWNLGDKNFKTYGNVKYSARSIDKLFNKVINNYPIKAIIYNKNHVIEVGS